MLTPGPPPRDLQSILEPDEKVLWWGAPSKRWRLRRADWFLIPFSIAWGGFAIFIGPVVVLSGQLIAAPIGILFTIIAVYILIGRFFHDSYRRSKAAYALTDKRVIIKSGKNVRSKYLESIDTLVVKPARKNEGTIELGEFPSMWANNGWGVWSGKPNGPAFELINDYQSVHDEIVKARKAAKAA